MLGSSTTKLLGLLAALVLLIASPTFGDTVTEGEASVTKTVTAQSSADNNSNAEDSEQAKVVVLTDPEIAATVDEEPDCE